MKSNHNFLILALFVAISYLAGCSSAPTDKTAQLEQLKTQQQDLSTQIAALEEAIAIENPSTAEAKAKDVSVTVIATRSFNHYIKTQGSVDAKHNIVVSSQAMGEVTNVYVKAGQQVTSGQLLAQIDNKILVSSIDELKLGLELATTVYERQKSLWDQNIGTEIQFLQAKSNKESLEIKLKTLKRQLDMSRITSPINGTVDAINLKTGENTAPGMPAFRVINTSDLKITANVSEAYIGSVKSGNKVLVEIPELQKTIEANVSFVGKNINPLSRTFAVEIGLTKEEFLRPNMSVVVKIIFYSDPSALVVPVNVVQSINGEKVLYVAESNNSQTIARRRVVEVDGIYDNLAHITSGIKPGDKVITFGYQGLNDSELIKI